MPDAPPTELLVPVAEEDGDTWEVLAWRLWCRGERTYTTILSLVQAAAARREVPAAPKDWRVVKRVLGDISRAYRVAMDQKAIDAAAEYVAGLQHDLEEATRLWEQSTKDRDRTRLLKQVSDLREKIATAKGVVTRRPGNDRGAPAPGARPTFTVWEVLKDEHATDLACQLARYLAGPRSSDAGLPGGGADERQVVPDAPPGTDQP